MDRRVRIRSDCGPVWLDDSHQRSAATLRDGDREPPVQTRLLHRHGISISPSRRCGVSGRDYRDDVLEILAASELRLQRNVWLLQEQAAELTERAVRAEAARDAYQLVAQTWARLSAADYQKRERLREQV